jgi:hypothetical protein
MPTLSPTTISELNTDAHPLLDAVDYVLLCHGSPASRLILASVLEAACGPTGERDHATNKIRIAARLRPWLDREMTST